MNALVFMLATIGAEPELEQAGLPPVKVADLKPFPDDSTFWAALNAANAHMKMCQEQRRMRLSPWLPWADWEAEAERTFMAWDALRESRWGGAEQLDRLKDLRERLGVQAYYAGVMPPPVYVNWLYPESLYDLPAMPEIDFD